MDVHPDAGHHGNCDRLLLLLRTVHSARPGLHHSPVALATVNRVRSFLCLLPVVLVCGPLPFTSFRRPTRAKQGKATLDQAGQAQKAREVVTSWGQRLPLKVAMALKGPSELLFVKS